eukprot:Nk52_evm4s2085 gene=Nk52_evmTU4s2085
MFGRECKGGEEEEEEQEEEEEGRSTGRRSGSTSVTSPVLSPTSSSSYTSTTANINNNTTSDPLCCLYLSTNPLLYPTPLPSQSPVAGRVSSSSSLAISPAGSKATPSSSSTASGGINNTASATSSSKETPSYCVFYDECNRQISVIADDKNVSLLSVDEKNNATISIPDNGPVLGLKTSLENTYICVQRTLKVVEVIYFNGPYKGFSQCVRVRGNSQIIGYCCAYPDEFVIVTSQGIEFYQINPATESIKLLKTFSSMTPNWFIYSSETHTLLVASSARCTSFQLLHFKPGVVNKLPKVDVDVSFYKNNERLTPSDVLLTTIYGRIYVIVVKDHEDNRGRGIASEGLFGGVDLVLYHVTRDAILKKVSISLDVSGKVKVGIYDNLILVHHPESKRSFILDLKMENQAKWKLSSSALTYMIVPYTSLAIGKSTNQFESVRRRTNSASIDDEDIELYSPSWTYHTYSTVVDSNLGVVWSVKLDMWSLARVVEDKLKLVQFLLRRRSSKEVILQVCCDCVMHKSLKDRISPHSSLSASGDIASAEQGEFHYSPMTDLYSAPSRDIRLPTISRIFDVLNNVYRYGYSASKLLQTQANGPRDTVAYARGCVVINQGDLFTQVMYPLVEDDAESFKYKLSVLVLYIQSLDTYRIPPQYFLYEMIIDLFVKSGKFYQLHQFLQYHIFSDTTHIVTVLLGLEKEYPPAYQLALDILKRLPNSKEQIVEVLMDRGQFFSALKILKSSGMDAEAPARTYLKRAAETGDKLLFYHVYRFFENRNRQYRKYPDFLAKDFCDEYVALFEDWFEKE